MTEFEHEPVPGLPEQLPAGESLIWQGAPDAWSVARHVMHANAVAAYFVLLTGWRGLSVWSDTRDAAQSLWSMVPLVAVTAVALGLVALVSQLVARTTIYSITSKRIVMRYGIALPVAVNVPYSLLASGDLRTYRDGTGDIALKVNGPSPLGYYHLWPHVRAWTAVKPQPTFRSLANVNDVSAVLTRAILAAQPAVKISPVVTGQHDGGYIPATPAAA